MANTERVVLYGGSVEIDYYPDSHRYKLIADNGEKKGDWLKSPSSIIDKLDKSPQLMHWAVGCFYDSVIENIRDGANFSRDDIVSMLEIGKGAYRERKQKAADVGSVVHEYAQNHHDIADIADLDSYQELSEEDKVKANHGANAFKSWYSQLGGKSIASEFLVYSRKHGYVGRCDELVDINGSLYILDYKTSKGVYSSQIYQVTAYMKAREEEYPDQKIAGARLIHLIKEDVLDKDGNVIKKAGEYGEVFLSRKDLVNAYVVFKALKTVADNDPLIQKLIK